MYTILLKHAFDVFFIIVVQVRFVMGTHLCRDYSLFSGAEFGCGHRADGRGLVRSLCTVSSRLQCFYSRNSHDANDP